MEEYRENKKNYNRGIKWHIQKSISYNWEKQINRFTNKLKGKLVLDAGCGSGRDITEFIKRGLKVEGVDYAEENIFYCRKKFPQITFYIGDIRKMDLPDKKYDGIWACASICNLKKREVLLALFEFKRILKPNGCLFISVKEGKGEKIVTDQAGRRFFSFYSLEELKELVGKAGFIVAYTEIVSDFELTGKASKPAKPNYINLYAVNS